MILSIRRALRFRLAIDGVMEELTTLMTAVTVELAPKIMLCAHLLDHNGTCQAETVSQFLYFY